MISSTSLSSIEFLFSLSSKSTAVALDWNLFFKSFFDRYLLSCFSSDGSSYGSSKAMPAMPLLLLAVVKSSLNIYDSPPEPERVSSTERRWLPMAANGYWL
jgi:hypothetical protein